jgi:ketosteroid isomerase-like protein
MTMHTPREVAESYWTAECRRDVDAVMDHYQADAWYQDAGGLLNGRAEIRGFYEGSARDYPRLEVAILREFVGSPGTSAFEVHAVLTDQDGRRFDVRGLNALTVRDGKIASLRCYEDPISPASPGGQTRI